MALREGDPAPDIHLDSDQGQPFHLRDHLGKNIVLYFYPRASTPGCTTEACEFRDAAPKFKDTLIVGVSPDTVKAQDKFKTKYELPFTLLADAEHKTAQDYGVWKEKNMYGKKVMGVERTTFVIAKDGSIAKIFNKVKPAGHAGQVLEALQSLP
jgi:thioredoxin-dependent peroxiredoxin